MTDQPSSPEREDRADRGPTAGPPRWVKVSGIITLALIASGHWSDLENIPLWVKVSAAVAIEQVQQLQKHGVDQFHFYTLNRAELAFDAQTEAAKWFFARG